MHIICRICHRGNKQPFSTSSPSREDRMKGPFVLLCTLKVGLQRGLQVGPGEKRYSFGEPLFGQPGGEMFWSIC